MTPDHEEIIATPGGIRRPAKNAPVEGTTRGRGPGAPWERRRDSLVTARWEISDFIYAIYEITRQGSRDSLPEMAIAPDSPRSFG